MWEIQDWQSIDVQAEMFCRERGAGVGPLHAGEHVIILSGVGSSPEPRKKGQQQQQKEPQGRRGTGWSGTFGLSTPALCAGGDWWSNEGRWPKHGRKVVW